MRSVARQEDAAGLVAVGDERGGFPDPVADVPHPGSVVTEAAPDQFQAAILGQRLFRFGVRIVGDREEPPALVVDRREQ